MVVIGQLLGNLMVIKSGFCTFHFPAFLRLFYCNYLYFRAFRGFFCILSFCIFHYAYYICSRNFNSCYFIFPILFLQNKIKSRFPHIHNILKQFLFEDNPYLIFLTTLILIEVLYLIFSYKYIILFL